MGTSSSNRGAGGGTPLLPSWAPAPPDSPVEQPASPASAPPETSPSPRPPIKSPPEKYRFRGPRVNFSRFVASGSTDRRALGRALSGHVRSVSGGARNAARRMGASSRTAANLVSLLRGISRDGLAETLRSLSLQHLAGKPPKEILAAFTELICSRGSLIDEAIARHAYVETVVELVEADLDLNTLTEEQVAEMSVDFIGRSIVLRVINDIGTKLDLAALSEEQASSLTRQLADFVVGVVRDRLLQEIQGTNSLDGNKLRIEMSRIYEVAFGLIELQATSLL